MGLVAVATGKIAISGANGFNSMSPSTVGQLSGAIPTDARIASMTGGSGKAAAPAASKKVRSSEKEALISLGLSKNVPEGATS